jgi:hypothetical protein
LRILVGKVNAKISFRKRAEDGISNSMGQRVSIRMTFATYIGSDVHTAKHEWSPFNEAMYVGAGADTEHWFGCWC